MTKEREILELINEYVETRAAGDHGAQSGANSLDEIADQFGQVLRVVDAGSEADRIPPIVDHEATEAQ